MLWRGAMVCASVSLLLVLVQSIGCTRNAPTPKAPTKPPTLSGPPTNFKVQSHPNNEKAVYNDWGTRSYLTRVEVLKGWKVKFSSNPDNPVDNGSAKWYIDNVLFSETDPSAEKIMDANGDFVVKL